MGLLDSERVPRRDFFIYFLIDCSSNMGGSKIGAVNDAMENMLSGLKELNQSNLDSNVVLRVIEINDNPTWLHDEGKGVDDFIWQDIHASGGFYFGKALDCLIKDIRLNSNSLKFDPVFILLTSSPSLDIYDHNLKRLNNMETFVSGHKIAIAIGDNCDLEMLHSFTKYKEHVITIHNIDNLKRIIRITCSDSDLNVSEDPLHGCKGDIALIIDKSIELFGKDIISSPRMLYILNDYEAFKEDQAKSFIFKTIQNDSKFELLLNSNNWNIDSIIYSKRLSHDTGIDYHSIQCVIDAIGLGMGHTIYIDRRKVKV